MMGRKYDRTGACRPPPLCRAVPSRSGPTSGRRPSRCQLLGDKGESRSSGVGGEAHGRGAGASRRVGCRPRPVGGEIAHLGAGAERRPHGTGKGMPGPRRLRPAQSSNYLPAALRGSHSKGHLLCLQAAARQGTLQVPRRAIHRSQNPRGSRPHPRRTTAKVDPLAAGQGGAWRSGTSAGFDLIKLYVHAQRSRHGVLGPALGSLGMHPSPEGATMRENDRGGRSALTTSGRVDLSEWERHSGSHHHPQHGIDQMTSLIPALKSRPVRAMLTSSSAERMFLGSMPSAPRAAPTHIAAEDAYNRTSTAADRTPCVPPWS